jgi:hypothetical protein
VEDEFIRDVVYLDDFKVEVLLVADGVSRSYGCSLLRLEPRALGVEAASFYEPVILKPSKMIHMLLSCYPLQLQIAKHLQSRQ